KSCPQHGRAQLPFLVPAVIFDSVTDTYDGPVNQYVEKESGQGVRKSGLEGDLAFAPLAEPLLDQRAPNHPKHREDRAGHYMDGQPARPVKPFQAKPASQPQRRNREQGKQIPPGHQRVSQRKPPCHGHAAVRSRNIELTRKGQSNKSPENKDKTPFAPTTLDGCCARHSRVKCNASAPPLHSRNRVVRFSSL